MSERYYTGIGSRQTPEGILRLMRDHGYKMARLGWTLRSGGAKAADSAFTQGAWDAYLANAGPKPEIYLPWPAFGGIRGVLAEAGLERPQDEAFSIAKKHHPAWDKLSRGAKMLHARNVHQVLGPDVTDPVLSSFVICWTPEAKGGGGTGQAIRIARNYDVPIFDLADKLTQIRVRHFLYGT